MRTAARKRRLLLILLAVALVGAVAIAAALLTREAGPSPVEEIAAEEPGPVLLVPGYGGQTAGLQALADRLREMGRDATVVPLAGDGTGDLRESAAALDAAATAARARTGAASVDVVGYSAGGLTARLWVADGNAGVVRRVVTLGTPHHGTGVASLAGLFAPDRCPEACRQMTPGSELLAELDADETPDGVDWVSVWTTQDRVVTPPDSARLDGALNLAVQSVCPQRQVSHLQLLGDPVVQNIVLAQLAAGDPVALTAEDCARLDG
ncbi:lipase family alpha/beta hydrolase [Blastococcus saxobsidens]|uniref:Putative Extracellular esterase estB n=1 Tax=Blastococcus saxobsidens (strain DD2) TaxID=1146883 RepID=H6RTM1_BLASD|nr:alpha/beta fold hydrolase [Blastococcus saxobsidens]CCG03081.1 putative Extracellular esterase estB [Blastococcus saxobsidens DD2]